MNVLAIMPALPWPLSDGIVLRAYHFLRAIAEHHDVHLLCPGPAEQTGPLPDLLAGLHISPSATEQTSKQKVGQVWPHQPALQHAVESLVRRLRPDRVWCTHLQMASYAPAGYRSRCLIDIIDDQVLLRREQWGDNKGGGLETLKRCKWMLEVGWLQRQAADRAALATFAARLDAEAFRLWAPSLPRLVVPNGVDLQAYRPEPPQPVETPYVVFYGNYLHPPNQHGVRVLAEDIWPEVHRHDPRLACKLIGPHLPDGLARLARAAGIEVTGWVESLQPVVRDALAVLSPLQTGSGIKNKVLEAWAMGKVVVALPRGVSGLEDHAREVSVLAQTPGQFARQLLALARRPERRRQLERDARTLVERHYAWSRPAGLFRTILEQLPEELPA
jgi:polysaccharide biosynthesis protein PslH